MKWRLSRKKAKRPAILLGFFSAWASRLAVGLPLDEAVTWARLQILLSGRDEKGRPSYEWRAFKVS